MRYFPLVAVLCLTTVGCGDDTTVVYPPTSPSPVSPSPTPGNPIVNTKIEFRVTGNANGARVRYSNAVDGLTQVVTTLPYTATLTTQESSMFLSLEGTPTSYNFNINYPFFAVQIFVNGNLFREATSSEFLLNTLSVSGTWRR
jgi:hypothetical protein